MANFDPEIKKMNDYIEELKKFVGKEVVMIDSNGNKHEGKCIAISYQHLNTIIETKNCIVVSKGICHIQRKK